MQESPKAPATVLLTEDNDQLRGIFALVLRSGGYAVIEAPDGLRATELAAEHLPDLILMDLSLPRMDGWEATQRIRANPATAQTPIIALSAFDRSTDLERSRDVGCNSHLTKPIDPKELLAQVRQWLEVPQTSE
jgi:CheY-like chemotaxis protein